jgi:hypothetical protein
MPRHQSLSSLHQVPGRKWHQTEGRLATVNDWELSPIERAILAILESRTEDVSGRELRSLIRQAGYRRSAPAFVFTMLRMADKGLVLCREEARAVEGVEFEEWYYRLPPWG